MILPIEEAPPHLQKLIEGHHSPSGIIRKRHDSDEHGDVSEISVIDGQEGGS